MAIVAGVHTANEAEIVGDLRGVGQQFAEIHAALAVLLELPRAAEELAAGFVSKAVLDVAGVVHAVAALQLGLGVCEVHVARAAVHEEGNHRLGPGRKVRLLGLQIKPTLSARDVLGRAEQFLTLQQPRQRQAANAHGVAGKELAAGVGEVVHDCRMSKEQGPMSKKYPMTHDTNLGIGFWALVITPVSPSRFCPVDHRSGFVLGRRVCR